MDFVLSFGGFITATIQLLSKSNRERTCHYGCHKCI